MRATYNWLTWSIIALLAACGQAQDTNKAAKIECLQPVYNFGSADNTGKVNNVYVLKNAGNAMLTITRVHACCGVEAKLAQTNIPPGTNTTLKISLSLAGRKGALTKSFYIHSNDPKNSIYQLRMIGVVTPAASNTTSVSATNIGNRQENKKETDAKKSGVKPPQSTQHESTALRKTKKSGVKPPHSI